MGFFSDLKEDLSQAVNELVTDENEPAKEENVSEQPAEDTAEEVSVPDDAEESSIMEEMEELFGKEETEEVFTPETSDDLGRMLEDMYPEESAEAETEEEEETEETETEEETIITVEEEEQVEETEYKGFETDSLMSQGVAAEETAIITAGMTIRGDISSQGSLDIIGSVEGNIEILGKLNITGNIEGASSAADVYAEKARINGDIHSAGSIKIGQSTIVIGNIYASSAVVAGAVKGDIDVKGPVVLDTSAIVMGNIKSKSVQINNGAVIEGLCSQCYADVNPSSFFEDIKKARK